MLARNYKSMLVHLFLPAHVIALVRGNDSKAPTLSTAYPIMPPDELYESSFSKKVTREILKNTLAATIFWFFEAEFARERCANG